MTKATQDNIFYLPFDPMHKIYWTGIQMGTPTALIAIFYLYYTVQLSPAQTMQLVGCVGVCLLLEFLLKNIIQYRLTPNIRRFNDYFKQKTIPPVALLQETWVETSNLPVKIVLIITFCLTLAVVVVPTAVYSAFFVDYDELWRHVLVSGLLAVTTLTLINLLLYENALIPLTGKIEELALRLAQETPLQQGAGQASRKLNFEDTRIMFVSIQLKFIIFFIGIALLLAVSISVLVYQKVAHFLSNPNLTPMSLAELRFEILVVSAFLFCCGFVLTFFMVNHQTRPINLIVRNMHLISQGKLRTDLHNMKASVVRDEGNLLAEVFSVMAGELKELIDWIHESCRSLANVSRMTVERTNDFHKQIKSQSEMLTSLSASLEESAAFSRRISEDGMKILEVMDTTLEDTRNGQDVFQEVIDGVTTIREAANVKQLQVEKFSLKLVEIEEVANIIRKVANQTQIIAFNAFLESADENETDRFEDIAMNVKNLTTQVTTAAQEVRHLIQGVLNSAKKLLESTEHEIGMIETGATTTQRFYDLLSSVVIAINQMNDFVRKITISTRQQERTTEAVVESLREVSAIVNTSSLDCQEMLNQISALQSVISQLQTTLRDFFPDNAAR